MTSPVILAKKERIWTFGVSADPFAAKELDSFYYLIQPVVGFRTGLGRNQEIGINLYGVVGPALVIDHKHKIFQSNEFIISGDIAVFGGYIRPIGGQYDLIFGNQKLYGTLGLGYDIGVAAEGVYYLFGLGSERINGTPYGFQLSFGRSLEGTYVYRSNNFLSIGLKYDLLRN